MTVSGTRTMKFVTAITPRVFGEVKRATNACVTTTVCALWEVRVPKIPVSNASVLPTPNLSVSFAMIVIPVLMPRIPLNAKAYAWTTITVVNAIIYAYQTALPTTQENVKE
jgi:hypothetical protein